jgi:methylglutaconyl-CoA hydratase
MLHLIPFPATHRAGGTQRLPRIVGRSRAKELIFTGRRFDAVEAVTMGNFNLIFPFESLFQFSGGSF